MIHALAHAIDAPLVRRQAASGVEDYRYGSVGEALIAALGESLGGTFAHDVRAAWDDAYALIASRIHRAAHRAGGAPVAGGRHDSPFTH